MPWLHTNVIFQLHSNVDTVWHHMTFFINTLQVVSQTKQTHTRTVRNSFVTAKHKFILKNMSGLQVWYANYTVKSVTATVTLTYFWTIVFHKTCSDSSLVHLFGIKKKKRRKKKTSVTSFYIQCTCTAGNWKLTNHIEVKIILLSCKHRVEKCLRMLTSIQHLEIERFTVYPVFFLLCCIWYARVKHHAKHVSLFCVGKLPHR